MTASAGGGGQATRPASRLADIAFVSPEDGYGLFERESGPRCHDLVGWTADGGARFDALTRVVSWPCADSPPAASLAVDEYGDDFLYGPRLFVSHDGGRTWAPGRQPGTVLAIAAIGRSIWLVRADCPHAGRPASLGCALRLLESANGGRSWQDSLTVPAGAKAPDVGNGVAEESAASQTWLLRTGRTSGYLLTGPATNPEDLPDEAPLWYTDDAGASWSARRVPCRLDALSVVLSAVPDGVLLGVCAGEPSAGFEPKSTARSANGGRTWTVHLACPQPSYELPRPTAGHRLPRPDRCRVGQHRLSRRRT